MRISERGMKCSRTIRPPMKTDEHRYGLRPGIGVCLYYCPSGRTVRAQESVAGATSATADCLGQHSRKQMRNADFGMRNGRAPQVECLPLCCLARVSVATGRAQRRGRRGRRGSQRGPPESCGPLRCSAFSASSALQSRRAPLSIPPLSGNSVVLICKNLRTSSDEFLVRKTKF